MSLSTIDPYAADTLARFVAFGVLVAAAVTCAAWLRDSGSPGVQSGTMLDVMDEARVRAGEAHAAWSERFNELFAQVAGEFGRGSRKRARAYVLGLLSHAERKNGWTLAEFAGDLSPDGMQRLLNFYAWDAGAVRERCAGTW